MARTSEKWEFYKKTHTIPLYSARVHFLTEALVREAGLEPAWTMPLDSKSSASTNSATLARMAHKKKNI